MEHKTSLVVALIGALLVTGFSLSAHAQLDSLLHDLGQHVAQQTEEKLEGRMDQRTGPSNAQAQNVSPMLRINGGYDFTPGPVTLFEQNFATTPVGAMPADIKTNGSGQVVTLQGFPGHWLELRDSSTYKLNPRIDLPNRFTVQFDVLPVAEKISDLDDFHFGFAHDNSVSSFMSDAYNYGAINAVDLGYQNGGGGDVVTASSATSYNNDADFDWRGYANQVMHVSIAVNGDQMGVYLNHTKVADSKLFAHPFTRYFFFSSSLDHKHDAKLLVSNLRIGGFVAATTAQARTQATRRSSH